MAYRGKYKVKKPEKYDGDFKNVVYRSLWERQFFRWCEDNDNVIKWNSEEIVVPYVCRTDMKPHRYFIDCYVKFKGGKTYLIEIKPEIQTVAPVEPKRKTKKYLTEVLTYVKNTSKWSAAEKYANERGWQFKIFTEKTLKRLGIRLLNS
jgi:hypothetical protein|tara:strand:+ start:5458 stop:5904 length:447 start_codon:yes stop_codon:yes gene_type:complete